VNPDQTVLVLDFGSQYTQLIARRVRENRVYSVVHPFDYPVAKIRELAPRAIIFSGGPQSVYSDSAPICSREVLELGIPVLCICYGMQLATYLLDGRVEPAPEREYGRADIDVAAESRLFAGTPKRQHVWASHGDRIIAAPPGFRVIACRPRGKMECDIPAKVLRGGKQSAHRAEYAVGQGRFLQVGSVRLEAIAGRAPGRRRL